MYIYPYIYMGFDRGLSAPLTSSHILPKEPYFLPKEPYILPKELWMVG